MKPAPLAALFALLLLLAAVAAPPAAVAAAPVAVMDLEGAITPVTVRLVNIAVDRAQTERAQALVFLLDTPGGL